MDEDTALLHRYAEHQQEAAFAEFVQRRLDLVYAVALRTTRDPHRAREAAQLVFTKAARQAGALARHPCLLGWLHRTTHHVASDLLRAERRRTFWETKAAAMTPLPDSADLPPEWERTRPLLDAALADLGEIERTAVLLRYFENRPYAEIGARLHLAENAARMRVERALGRIHALLERRGVTSTATALTAALAHHAGTAAPAGLSTAIASAATTAAASGGVTALLALLTAPKITTALLVATAATLALTVVQQRTNAALAVEIDAARTAAVRAGQLRTTNSQLLAQAATRAATPDEAAELARLRTRLAFLQRPSYRRSWIRTRGQEIPPNTPPAEWLDRMMPGSFSQPTRVWQTMRMVELGIGSHRADPELIGATFCLDAAARTQVERFQASLPAEAFARTLAPEVLLAPVLDRWLWRDDPPQRYSPKRNVPHETDSNRAYAEIDITYRSGRRSVDLFPCYRLPDGWRYGPLTVDDVAAMIALLDPRSGEPKSP